MVTKPPIFVNAIPAEWRQRDRWDCWKQEDKSKPSYIPGTDKHASCTNPAHWASFDVALEALRKVPGYAGLTFAVIGDGYIVIDLDRCRNAKNGRIAAWARKIIKRFNSYTEVSSSGTGVHIILKGKLPPQGRKQGRIEVYADKRFICVTGRQLTSYGAGKSIKDRSKLLLEWHGEVFANRADSAHTHSVLNPTSSNGAARLPEEYFISEDRLKHFFTKKPQARVIFEGKSNGQYASQSDAEQALANMAINAELTDAEAGAVLSKARWKSRQKVSKAERIDYIERTLAKAHDRDPGQVQSVNQHKRGGGDGSSKWGDGSKLAPLAIAEGRKIFSKWLLLPDANVVDVVLAVAAGNKVLTTDPLWLFLKGPPGGAKTELLRVYQNLPSWAVLVSTLTPTALVSAYMDQDKPGMDHSLLPQLNEKCLIIKDFTTILSLPWKVQNELFGILRDCYDGHAAKNFGTGRREYNSRFNLLAGTTSAIERGWERAVLGERFLCWSMKPANLSPEGEEQLRQHQARRALDNANQEPRMRAELAKAAARVLAGLGQQAPSVPRAIENQTIALANLLAKLRTYVGRDNKDVVQDAPEVEVPTRIVKQLLRLGQSLALVRRLKSVTAAEFALMKKVALDSVPSTRLSVFHALRRQCDITADNVATDCRISATAAWRHLDDLQLLHLVEPSKSTKGEHKGKTVYNLTAAVRTEWRQLED
jgi:hypothetical protein